MHNEPWTKGEVDELVRDYPTTFTKELAARFKRTPNSVYLKAKQLELEKSFTHLQSMSKFLDGKRSRKKETA